MTNQPTLRGLGAAVGALNLAFLKNFSRRAAPLAFSDFLL